jgi:hypothetical protein
VAKGQSVLRLMVGGTAAGGTTLECRIGSFSTAGLHPTEPPVWENAGNQVGALCRWEFCDAETHGEAASLAVIPNRCYAAEDEFSRSLEGRLRPLKRDPQPIRGHLNPLFETHVQAGDD